MNSNIKTKNEEKLRKEYYGNGNIKSENYYQNNKRHRLDGPAYIYYNENGIIVHEEYWIDGGRHREDGPAVILYYEDRSIKTVEYYLNSKQHREDGPADIFYYKNGNKREDYYIDGIKYEDMFQWSVVVGSLKET